MNGTFLLGGMRKKVRRKKEGKGARKILRVQVITYKGSTLRSFMGWPSCKDF